MENIRPFVPDDIPGVAALHEWVFKNRPEHSPQSLQDYFAEIFFGNPWYDARWPSLVASDSRGRVAGFLGVLPRPVCLDHTPLTLLSSSQLMVAPSHRGAAGLQLLKAFLGSAPALFLTDGANDRSRKLWHALGGSTALLYSLHWMRPLRPAGYVVNLAKNRPGWRPAATLAGPLCGLLDSAIARFSGSRFRPEPPVTVGHPLTPQRWLDGLQQLTGNYRLKPFYTIPSLTWLLEQARACQGHGALQRVQVQARDGTVAGWFLYYLKPGGICQVMQIGATERTISAVLNHLFYHAWERGGVALCGRLDPVFLPALSEARCLLSRGGTWTLAHCQDPAVLRPILEGNAFLSRLEGEWWLRFQVDSFD